MSAYILSEKIINKIVNGAAGYSQYVRLAGELLCLKDAQDLEKIGQILTDENYRSVNYRYNERDDSPKFTHLQTLENFSPVEMLKALDCLEYQSCEHPEWKGSRAFTFVCHIRGAAISNLPGYDEAKWLS